MHHWHAPQLHRPALPGLPRVRLTPQRVAALRRGLIVALCALLAGGLTYHLRGAPRGPFSPSTAAAAARA